MAVPKTTETRCRDGSVQARQDIKRLHKQPHPYMVIDSKLSVIRLVTLTYFKIISPVRLR